MILDGCYHGTEIMHRAECALLNFLEHLCEIRVDGVGAVCMCVAQVFNVLSQVTKEENVVFANFPGNLNLCLVSVASQCST